MRVTARTLGRVILLALVPLAFGGVIWKLAARQKPPQSGASSDPHQNMPNMPDMPNMPGMDHSNGRGMSLDPSVDDSSHKAEQGAMSAMNHGPVGGEMHHHMGPHMYMTQLRPATPEDWAKADEIVAQTREAIAKYKDYKEAIADGFHIFLPNLPQPEYHFTNYWNGFLESFSFDPSRPTSLLYKKTKTGYELTGVMFTMPKNVSEEQLNERIPLSVAQWHLHTNLCMPPRDRTEQADWTRFGLQGSIITKQECSQANGKFYPIIFGWMVHVYPFEDSRAKVWGQ